MSGWRLTTGLEQGTTSYRSFGEQSAETGTCQVGHRFVEDFRESWIVITTFQWTDASGTAHVFDAQTEEPLEVCSGDTSHTQPNGGGYAIDGSGYRLEVTNYTQMTVYDTSGNEVYPVEEDPNGNTASISSSGTVTDSMGRTLLTTTTGTNTITYNVLKEGGGTNTFTVNTEPISVATNFQQSAVSEFNGSLTAIQSVQLPDGSSYSFTYDSGSSPGNYGEVENMTLPTGGTVLLAYTNYLDSYQNENRWIASETENSNTTTFAPAVLTQCSSGDVGCQEQMTLTRPVGDSRVYTLTLNNGAWDGETDTYLGAAQSSTKLMTVVNNYDFTSYPCLNSWMCTGAMYVTASSSTTTLTDVSPSLTAQTLYTSTAPWTGKVSTVQEFDYGASSPTRETDYTYGDTLNGASLLTQENKKLNGNPFSQTVYSYDLNGNLASKVEGLSGGAQATTSYAYDSNGMRTSKTDPNGNVTSYAYTCSDGYVAQTTYPSTGSVSHITDVNPDCSSGDPLSETDQNGQVTHYGYDSIGRKSSITYPDGGQTSYSYPSPNEVVESKLLSGSTSSTVTKIWDGYGRKSQTSQSDPAGADTVTYSYDADGRLQCTSNPQRGGSAPTNGTTCSTYDALDRATLITQPDGSTIQVAYSGSQATVTDENGHQKRYQYDAFHDLTAVWEPNAVGTPSWETTYAYDAAGHVTNITQVGDGSSSPRVRSFTYDDLGRLTSQTTPEQGTTSYGYDNNGNLTSRLDARNITLTYAYDALNRLTSKSSSDGTVHSSYTYDSASVGGSGGFQSSNPVGRLVEASNGANASEQFSYDSMGRIVDQASCIPTNCTQTGNAVYAQYDLDGDLTSLTYPDGRAIAESYDSAQHLTGIQYASWNGQGVNSSYYTATGFTPAGATTNAAFGNGVQMAASFNSRQAIAALSYATASRALWSRQYAWAANAKNLLQITDTLNSAQTFSYSYDPDNRLTSASGDGVSESYSLDPWGNQQDSGSFNFQQSFTANNQIIAVDGYSYDAAGNLLTDGLNAYTYDGEGMLTATNGAQYVYDALQQRVEKTGGSSPAEFIYFNGKPVALYDPANGAWTDLIWAGNNLLAEVAGAQAATPEYRLLDHEGSLAATTDASGNVTGTNLMLPYGETLSSNTNDPYVFAGLYQDTEYADDDAWYRNYSAEPSRWLTPDPYNGSYDLMNPQSMNRYAYVNNNPLGFTDPSGMAGAGVFTGVGGAPCKTFGAPNIPVGFGLGLNPCNPVGSAISDAVTLAAAYVDAYQTGQGISSVLSTWHVDSQTGMAGGYDSTLSGIGASVGAAITIGCSIDSNSDLCGQTGWTGALIGGDGGKVVGDSIAVAGAIACFAGPEACLGYGIYTIANDLFSVFWGLSQPKFTGSLLPRPSDLGGLGTAPIGIPNQNLTVQQLLGSSSTGVVPSPGTVHP